MEFSPGFSEGSEKRAPELRGFCFQVPLAADLCGRLWHFSRFSTSSAVVFKSRGTATSVVKQVESFAAISGLLAPVCVSPACTPLVRAYDQVSPSICRSRYAGDDETNRAVRCVPPVLARDMLV